MLNKRTQNRNIYFLLMFTLLTIFVTYTQNNTHSQYIKVMIFLINHSSQRTVQETKGWDVFREFPPKQDSVSMETQKWLECTVRLLKVLAYLVTFVVVLGSGVIAKGTVLFMTSQLRKDRRLAYCNRNLGMLIGIFKKSYFINTY